MNRGNRAETPWRSRTIAIVGAGFSGTALAMRLLSDPPPWPCRVVLIDCAARFGRGIAYSACDAEALLNVPADRMSLDEQRPDDLLQYLRNRGMAVASSDFVSRRLYGDYLVERLAQSAAAAPARVPLARMHGEVRSVTRAAGNSLWKLELADGRSVLADAVVLATGQLAPKSMPALRPLLSNGLYVSDPWAVPLQTRPGARVLLIGTGLTMADVACALARQQQAPQEIVAVSRRGILARSRPAGVHATTACDINVRNLLRPEGLRELVSVVRAMITEAVKAGGDWRDVIAALRTHVPELWRRLGAADRLRFMRHVQPYWDAHRHQLPPPVGSTVLTLINSGRLRIRAAHVASAKVAGGRAVIGLRSRGTTSVEFQAFDAVFNCSGPETNPSRIASPLVRDLLAAGHLASDPSGVGVQIDDLCRPTGLGGSAAPGLYYIGPWLKSRDFEATAVPELRVQATALAALLRRDAEWGAAAA